MGETPEKRLCESSSMVHISLAAARLLVDADSDTVVLSHEPGVASAR